MGAGVAVVGTEVLLSSSAIITLNLDVGVNAAMSATRIAAILKAGNDALTRLFDSGTISGVGTQVARAQEALRVLQETRKLPLGVTQEMLQAYREVALRSLQNPKNNEVGLAIQAIRLQIVDLGLALLKEGK